MRFRDARTTRDGAVYVAYEVTLLPEKEGDMDELRRALAVVDRYRKTALKALKVSEKNADFTVVGYGVKNDCVIVTVEQGANG